MELMFRPLRHYADFTGRSRRTEYWLFMLFKLIVYLVLWTIVVLTILDVDNAGEAQAWEERIKSGDFPFGVIISLLVLVITWLFFFIPSLAVQIRRFHDQGMSGWLGLLNIPYYIPYLGTLVGLALLILMMLPGNNGPNLYGTDPKGGEGPDQGLRNVFN